MKPGKPAILDQRPHCLGLDLEAVTGVVFPRIALEPIANSLMVPVICRTGQTMLARREDSRRCHRLVSDTGDREIAWRQIAEPPSGGGQNDEGGRDKSARGVFRDLARTVAAMTPHQNAGHQGGNQTDSGSDHNGPER